MAMIADIAVFQCDNCRATFVCKDKHAWEQFEESWHNGLIAHYCQTCKLRPEIVALIAEERECFKQASVMLDQESSDV